MNYNNYFTSNLKKIFRKKYVNSSFSQYHLDILESLYEKYGLKNKRIIDVGGSNIPIDVMKSFEVTKFVCLDPISKCGYAKIKNKCFLKNVYKLSDFEEAFNAEYSFILDENIEKVGNILNNEFDIAISISAFEHVTSLKITLNKIYNMLTENGFLHAQYEPIYTCATGHHVYINQNINFNNLPEIDFMHLLYSKNEAKKYLSTIPRLSDDNKRNILEQVYDSTHINRFSINQHIEAIFNSKFKKFNLDYFYLQPVPIETQRLLKSKFGNMRYDVRGIKLSAFKQ